MKFETEKTLNRRRGREHFISANMRPEVRRRTIIKARREDHESHTDVCDFIARLDRKPGFRF